MDRRSRLFASAILVALASPVAAQQVPGAIGPPPSPDRSGPDLSRGQPAPPALPSGADETSRLLRAQTDALRALAARLDQLERRIDRLERGSR